MWKYYLFLAAAKLLGPLPLRALYLIAYLSGTAAFYLNRRARRAVYANLEHLLLPTIPRRRRRHLARLIFINVARYYADLIRMPHIDVERTFRRHATLEGLEHLTAALERGGVILTGAHYGSPELVFQFLRVFGISALALTEPLQPRAFSDLVHRLRDSQGQTFLPVSFSAMKLAIRTLKQGGVVVIVADRDIQKSGVCVRFCGALARMPTGVIHLALRTGATILPVHSYRSRWDHFHIIVKPPFLLERTGNMRFDTVHNVERLLTIFERYLRQDPSQWIVLEPIWEGCEEGVTASANEVGANVTV